MGPTLTRRFRIYTGYTDDLPTGDIYQITALATNIVLSTGIENFTRYIERGYWNSTGETSLIFEIISSAPETHLLVQNAATLLKQLPEAPQEAVLVTIEPVETYLI